MPNDLEQNQKLMLMTKVGCGGAGRSLLAREARDTTSAPLSSHLRLSLLRTLCPTTRQRTIVSTAKLPGPALSAKDFVKG